MKYSKEEVMQYVHEEDVKFIRIAFCDVFGKQKNISIMPPELPRAFEYGIPFDAAAITGFADEAHSDLILHPDPQTLMVLPWRPEHGRVVRMFSYITYPDGTPFECDTRNFLNEAVNYAQNEGYAFDFGSEQEFYLFLLDENGKPTYTPYDQAGYMDIAPDDRGENIRREICLTLEQMGIIPESSHHEEGPGQNEIDFRYSDPMSAADNTMTFQTVVKTVSRRNGLHVDFSPKPLKGKPGNGFHINLSLSHSGKEEEMNSMIAGVLNRICEITAFLNPIENSYARFGEYKAPAYVSWARENRTQLIRVPFSEKINKRAEIRSPDPYANPYIAFGLVIYAAVEGLKNKAELMPAAEINLFNADAETLKQFKKIPQTLEEARNAAKNSEFVKKYVPEKLLEFYCGK